MRLSTAFPRPAAPSTALVTDKPLLPGFAKPLTAPYLSSLTVHSSPLHCLAALNFLTPTSRQRYLPRALPTKRHTALTDIQLRQTIHPPPSNNHRKHVQAVDPRAPVHRKSPSSPLLLIPHLVTDRDARSSRASSRSATSPSARRCARRSPPACAPPTSVRRVAAPQSHSHSSPRFLHCTGTFSSHLSLH